MRPKQYKQAHNILIHNHSCMTYVCIPGLAGYMMTNRVELGRFTRTNTPIGRPVGFGTLGKMGRDAPAERNAAAYQLMYWCFSHASLVSLFIMISNERRRII
ncbi:hypothetical protein F4781DRAFT_385588 [Annulohypoxylon bovei var. microspora]|nr:hypothetical protein F4781DRAFT_385588 [Annulohypoxylon bovei var. microspora]